MSEQLANSLGKGFDQPSKGDVTLVSMPGRGWLLLEAHGLTLKGLVADMVYTSAPPWMQVVASLLVASDGFNRQLQCSRDWNASNVVPLCLPCAVPEGIDTCMYDFSGCWAHQSSLCCFHYC